MTSTRTHGGKMIWAFVEHEHEELVAGIDRIHVVAEELATLPADRKSASVAKVLRWVNDTLKPHMAWEELWLCPQINDRAQTPWVTRLVRFDHRQIAHQADRLKMHQSHLDNGPSSETIVQVFSDLIGLEALLRANLEREEHFLVPLLEREAGR
jgi:iron-sulfur cluster repair protein YtfE (RIC family)